MQNLILYYWLTTQFIYCKTKIFLLKKFGMLNNNNSFFVL